MAENLAYLPYISPFTSDTGIFVYNYKGTSAETAKNQKEFKTYGCLYSWEISLQVCPDGWHLPGDEEWQELERSIGMTSNQILQNWESKNIYQSNYLKSTDWPGKSNNVTLFSALPGGYHFYEHNPYTNLTTYFNELGTSTNFWSSTTTEFDDSPYTLKLDGYGITRFTTEKNFGYSVRCVKN